MEAAAEKYRMEYGQLRGLVNQYGLQELKEKEYREAAQKIREERQRIQGNKGNGEHSLQLGIGNTQEIGLRNARTSKGLQENGVEKAQKILLTWFSVDPILIEKLSNIVALSDFKSEFYHEVAKVMYAMFEKNHCIEPAAVINHFQEVEEQKRAADIFYENSLDELSMQEKERALHELIRKIKEYSLSYDSANVTDLTQLQKIYKEKEKLKTLKIQL